MRNRRNNKEISFLNLIFRGVVLFAMVVGRLPFEVKCKKPVSKKERRELFAVETKMGIRTVKHQNYMSSTSVGTYLIMADFSIDKSATT
jgi:hypothetical protein